jgi:hypothetical protein
MEAPTTPAIEQSKKPRKNLLINRNFAFLAISGVFGWFALPKEAKTTDTSSDTTN